MAQQTSSRYRILGQLGAGGMGVVYEAEDLRLGRHVALKFLPEAIANDPHALGRFTREARAASALDHPHICTIHDIDQDEQGRTFIVMEKLEGASLAEKLRRGPLDADELLQLSIQVADALAAVHAKGIIHRDLKPQNVFVTTDGQVKLLDFGLAKPSAREPGGELTASDVDSLTSPGARVGTLPYMSPEQVLGKQLDARTDLFSFGAVLYQMATGKMPFEAPSGGALSDAILHATPDPVVKSNAVLPAELDRMIGHALEKDREIRYQSAAEMRADFLRLQRSRASAASGAVAPLMPEKHRRRRWAIAVGAAIVLVAASVAILLYPHRVPALTEKDQILIVPFENRTGDPVFDGTLESSTAVALGQSPYLRLVPGNLVGETLKLMGKPPDIRVTPEIGREICQRNGVKALLTGSIARFGSRYLLTVSVLNAASGESLAQGQRDSGSKDDVIRVLGELVSELRTEIGDKVAAIPKFNKPLWLVTSSSIEALRAQAEGAEALSDGDYRGAILYFQQAIKLDPNFSMAYSRLGTAYSNLGYTAEAEAMAQRAFELSDRVSERERAFITVKYHQLRGDRRQAIEALDNHEHTYGETSWAELNKAAMYFHLAEYDKSIQHSKRSIQLDAGQSLAYHDLIWAELRLGNLDEAKRVLQTAQDRKIGGPLLLMNLAYLALMQGDSPLAEQYWKSASATASGERMAHEGQSFRLAARGRMREYRAANALIVEEERSAGSEGAAYWLSLQALIESLLGYQRESRATASRALKLSNSPAILVPTSLAYAFSGDSSRAETLIEQAMKKRPADTLLQSSDQVLVHGIIALNRGQLTPAIELLAAAKPNDSGNNPPPNYLLLRHARGLAYLAAGRSADAQREFQAIMADRSERPFDPLCVIAELGSARAYVAAGDKVKARTAYEQFFTSWADADRDIPLLKQAKAEYGRLDRDLGRSQ